MTYEYAAMLSTENTGHGHECNSACRHTCTCEHILFEIKEKVLGTSYLSRQISPKAKVTSLSLSEMEMVYGNFSQT